MYSFESRLRLKELGKTVVELAGAQRMKKSILETILDPRELSVRFQPIFQIQGDSRDASIVSKP